LPPLHSIRSRLERAAGTAPFAYGSIFLLQSKLLWGIWSHRDLSSGDTSVYFHSASDWSQSFHIAPIASPLYTVAWGSLRWLFDDPYTVTIAHRMLIAVGASLMVLAVLRRLLSPGIAWALAVWWTVLPINYDNLYEVHLFAVIATLVAVLIATRWRGVGMRSAVFAVLLLDALLVRNETAIALVIWTLAWIACELRLRRAGSGTPRRILVRAFAVPVLAAAVLMAAALAAYPDRAHFLHNYSHRQAANVCQDYAFGYEQRHSDYRLNPFSGCGPLSERQFGTDYPSWLGAATANPRAMAGHVLWNAELAPQGLQLMLFDGISAGAGRDPDFIPVHTDSAWSLAGLIVVIIFVSGGVALLWRDRRRWWLSWIRERAWGWLALLSLGAMGAVMMLWQRPRPAYALDLGVLILAAAGLSAMAYADRWPGLNRARAAIPAIAVLLILVVPSHYGSGYVTPQTGRPGRPVKDMVDRLYPLRDQLAGHEVKLLATYAGPGCLYVGGADPCKPIEWKPILSRAPGVSVGEALAMHDVHFIYFDLADSEDPAKAGAIREAEAAGWTRAAPSSPGQGWILLVPPSG
jgi:hypothetical protein